MPGPSPNLNTFNRSCPSFYCRVLGRRDLGSFVCLFCFFTCESAKCQSAKMRACESATGARGAEVRASQSPKVPNKVLFGVVPSHSLHGYCGVD